jgi:tetratricopeptide (TPR) repeat protein
LCAAIAALAPIAAADPYEADPDLATRDDDYAAGKRAVEKKDWAEAARLFQRAEIRNPDHADLQNILGFSYRNLKQYDLAFKHYRARHRARSAPSRRARVHRRDVSHDRRPGGGGEAPRSAQGDMPAALRGIEGPRARDCGVPGQEIIAVENQAFPNSPHTDGVCERRFSLHL